MSRAAIVAIGLVAVLGAGCGGTAQLQVRVTQRDVDSITVSVLNTGGASTGPLTLTLDAVGIFFVENEDCAGRALASEETCAIRIGYPVTNMPQPEGTLTVDDGHGLHTTTALDVVLAGAQLSVTSFDHIVRIGEGETGDAVVNVSNSNGGPTGPIALNFPGANIVSDTCSGVSLRQGANCAFTIEYTAPTGGNPPKTVTGTVEAEPGGSVPVTIQFEVGGRLYTSGLPINSPAAAGASGTVNITANLDTGLLSIGPLQLSIVDPNGVPGNEYLPFLFVPGQDHCSGQTLTTAVDSCQVVIGLDPRLPANRGYSATLLVQVGAEMTTLPMMVMRGTP